MFFGKNEFVSKKELLLLLLGTVVLLAIIFIFQRPPFYDEDEYLSNVQLIHQYGFSKTFLLKEVGSAGPLYATIHWLFEPITHLSVPYVRLVNILFLLGTVVFIGKIIGVFYHGKQPFALFIMAIPMTYIAAGLALTEITAMFFLSAGIFFTLTAVHSQKRKAALVCRVIVGGLFVSLAIVGRQPYLLTVLLVPVLFNLRYSFHRWLVLLFTICSLVLPAMVFYIWGNLMPPEDADYFRGLALLGIHYRVDAFIICIAYYFVFFLIIAPDFFIPITKRYLGYVLFAFIIWCYINFKLHLVKHLMITLIIQTYIPQDTTQNYIGTALGSVLVSMAIYFIITLVIQIHKNGYRKEQLFFAGCMCLVAIACIKITGGFTSRYAAQAIPFILPFASFFYKNNPTIIWRVLIGLLLGVWALLSYFLLSP